MVPVKFDVAVPPVSVMVLVVDPDVAVAVAEVGGPAGCAGLRSGPPLAGSLGTMTGRAMLPVRSGRTTSLQDTTKPKQPRASQRTKDRRFTLASSEDAEDRSNDGGIGNRDRDAAGFRGRGRRVPAVLLAGQEKHARPGCANPQDGQQDRAPPAALLLDLRRRRGDGLRLLWPGGPP